MRGAERRFVDKPCTIYVLRDPATNGVRYVGKTVDTLPHRLMNHLSTARKNNKRRVCRWIATVVERGERPIIEAVETVPAGEAWDARETHWINHYRDAGCDLTNLTDGGEGLAGYVPPPQHRERIAIKLRRGQTFKCETCQAEFWRKPKEIEKGDCRFCSRECYAASLKGQSRPMPAGVHEKGVVAAAAKRSARLHCKRGHLLAGDNLFKTKDGVRHCKQCNKLHKATHRKKHDRLWEREEVFDGCRLLLGNCMRVLPALGPLAHVITDPPYEASLHDAKTKSAGRLRTDGRADLRTLDFQPVNRIRRPFVEQVQELCEGWFIAFCTVEGAAEWARVINPSRIKYKRACIWIKPDSTPQLNAQGPAQGAEIFVAAWAGRGHASWNAGGKRGVYTHNIRQKDRHGEHPTEKPASLMREILADFTKPGDLVCDPFMGSGTTGVAALALGRRFVGVELNPAYFDIACRRIEKAAKQPDLFVPPVRLRPKERRALAPEFDLPAMLPPLVPQLPAMPMHFKDDGPAPVDKDDRRSE